MFSLFFSFFSHVLLLVHLKVRNACRHRQLHDHRAFWVNNARWPCRIVTPHHNYVISNYVKYVPLNERLSYNMHDRWISELFCWKKRRRRATKTEKHFWTFPFLCLWENFWTREKWKYSGVKNVTVIILLASVLSCGSPVPCPRTAVLHYRPARVNLTYMFRPMRFMPAQNPLHQHNYCDQTHKHCNWEPKKSQPRRSINAKV